MLDDPPAQSLHRRRRRRRRHNPRDPLLDFGSNRSQGPEILRQSAEHLGVQRRQGSQRERGVQRDGDGDEPEQEDRDLLRGWQRGQRALRRDEAVLRRVPGVLSGSSEYDGDGVDAQRAGEGRHIGNI
ncbi:hypothetical protein J5N97_022880 [Dioscorea zingiberensis]|uniref:Uncharacterized protein n=1 Tax=Dioscorea zingiberensis TaxID=325984 RepID=A0A9D5CB89_9LILI|nr:hypothetical protein J5N97_022880 [Dioscorea zingiberensis]